MFVQSITIIYIHSSKDLNWIHVKKHEISEIIKKMMFLKSVFKCLTKFFFLEKTQEYIIIYH